MERRIHHSIYELLPTGSATLVTWAAAAEQSQSAAAATSSGIVSHPAGVRSAAAPV